MPPTSIDGTDITGATIDGTDVQEITVDGDTVFIAGPVIPNNLVNRLPLDEGVGTSVSDSVGNANGTLTTGTDWESNTAFFGSTAPNFDAPKQEDGEWSPRSQAPITVTLRASLDTASDTPYLFGYNRAPALRRAFDFADSWTFWDGNFSNRAVVGDSFTDGEIRVFACRLDSSTIELDVWEEDGTKVGNDSVSNPSTTFEGSTQYLGDRGDGKTANYLDGNVDLIDVYDVFLTDQTLSDNISDVYL